MDSIILFCLETTRCFTQPLRKEALRFFFLFFFFLSCCFQFPGFHLIPSGNYNNIFISGRTFIRLRPSFSPVSETLAKVKFDLSPLVNELFMEPIDIFESISFFFFLPSFSHELPEKDGFRRVPSRLYSKGRELPRDLHRNAGRIAPSLCCWSLHRAIFHHSSMFYTFTL
jgi:hypothetical protein